MPSTADAGKRGYLRENFRFVRLKDSRAQQIGYHYHEFDKVILLLGGKVTYVVEGHLLPPALGPAAGAP